MSVRIKQQGGIYTVIRSTYNSSVGRGVDTTIGSFKIESLEIPDDLLQKITDNERSDLQSKFSMLRFKKKFEAQMELMKAAPGSIRNIAAALRNHARFGGDEAVQEVFAAMADLKLALREAGYKQKREKQEPVSTEQATVPKAATAAQLGAKNGANKS